MSSGQSPHGNRRAEYPFTASLATIDSETPIEEESSPLAGTWDTETDHLLSYFLGGESQGPPTADFASTTSSNASTLTGAFHTESENQTGMDTGSFLPPTPAVHFFAHRSSGYSRAQKQFHQQDHHQLSIAPTASQSSSSSSLSSMAAALVSGVSPGMLQNQTCNTIPPRQAAEMSPISPAALIGNAQENLFLPGPDGIFAAAMSMGPPAPREPKAPTWPQPGGVPLLPAAAPPYAYHWAAASAAAPPESEEKRAKRLERNRVSARKSRRKKKERLETLSQAVNQLHDTVELKRRDRINDMMPAFLNLRASVTTDTVSDILDLTSPHSDIQRAVLEFQYAQLKNMTLPGYQKLLLWFTLQESRFFTAGKEGQTEKPLGKVSSKQIGEEITKSSASHKVGTSQIGRWWPLFCFEIKFSVDQEERLVKAVSINAEHQRRTMARAVETADRLSKAVNSLSHLVARREEKTFAVLSHAQAAKLQRWKSGRKVDIPNGASSAVALNDICHQLNRVLQISSSSDMRA